MGKDKKKSDMDDDDDLFGILKDDTDMRDTRAKRIYKQHYRKAWEKETDFKGWLTSVPDQPNRAYCKACRTTLHAHRLTLVKHTISVKHMKASVAYYEAASYQTKQMDKSCEMIELQVDTNINSEDEGGMVLVGDALQTKKSDNNNALKKDCSQLGERHTTDDSALSEIQSSPELNSDNNEDRLRDELADDPADSKVITSNTSKETGRSLVLARPDKPPISTHVLDTTRGLPVSGIRVILYQLINGRWTHLNDSCTNPDGRCADLIDRESVKPGRYKMHFETHQYFELRGLDCLFPFVEVVFDVRSPAEYLHIPVLMTPYSYSVYRGS